MTVAELIRPRDVGDAVARLGRDGARPVAGGVGLTLDRHARGGEPSGPLVSIAELPELRGVEASGHGLRVGAGERLADLERHAGLAAAWPVAAEAIASVATTRIRRLVTLGGNLAALDPAHDPLCGLIAAGATIEIASARGRDELPLEQLTPAALDGGLILAVHLPAPPARGGSAYRKFLVRGVWEYACVAVGATLGLEADGRVATARVALGSVAPGIVLAPVDALAGQHPSAARLDAVAAAAAAACDPTGDVRGSAAYKREMTAVHTRLALDAALARAGAPA